MIDPHDPSKTLKKTIMYENGKRIEGYHNVVERLRLLILDEAKELGGKNLRSRDFVDAFTTRGPDYSDVIRKVMIELQGQGKIRITNTGKGKRNYYRYDVIK